MMNDEPGNCECRNSNAEPRLAHFDIRNSTFELRPIRRALIEADLVDTALRDSVFTQSEAIPQVLSAAKNNMAALPA